MVRGASSVQPRSGKPHSPTTPFTSSLTWAAGCGSMVGRDRARVTRVHIEHTAQHASTSRPSRTRRRMLGWPLHSASRGTSARRTPSSATKAGAERAGAETEQAGARRSHTKTVNHPTLGPLVLDCDTARAGHRPGRDRLLRRARDPAAETLAMLRVLGTQAMEPSET
jgi:hypothetical protein